MRILVYGAGVLGCNLAADLCKAGKDVTLLARGEWASQIRKNGLVFKGLFRKKTIHIPVIETLEPQDRFDAIFIVMQYSQLDSVVSILKENVTENLVFVGNNTDAKRYEELFKNKSVWFGFSSSAGKRENGQIKSVSMHKITIGSAEGECHKQDFISEIFAGSKMKVTYSADMDEWLKTHVAFILPLANACYQTEGNLKKIKNDAAAINRIIDEMKHNYESMMNKGYKVVPYSEYEYVTHSREKCYKFIVLMCATPLGKIAICDHAMSARDEMDKLGMFLACN